MTQAAVSSFLPYAKQSINEEDKAAVAEALSSDWITRGPKVRAFEKALAAYCEAEHAVFFNSGSSALFAACRAVELKPCDRVLTTPNSFIATIASALFCKATVVFSDIDPATGNLCLEQMACNIKQSVSRGRKILLPVHYAGIALDMQKLESLVSDPDTMIIEDAAAALGSLYPDGRKVGCCAWSHMTMFSFHPAKNITTGEGGVITTNNADLACKLRLLRNSGIEQEKEHFFYESKRPGYYEIQELSGNFNVTEMQAALGLSQLKRIEMFRVRRQEIVNQYRELFQECKEVQPLEAFYCEAVFAHLFVVKLADALAGCRDKIMNRLKEKGIGTQVHYIPLYRHPLMRKSCTELAPYFPNMEAFYQSVLSLPLYVDLTQQDIKRVVSTVKEVVREYL